jgi:hypothetical protein
MPRLRTRRMEPAVRVLRRGPDETVVALSDVSKGGRYVQKGTRIDRNDEMVRELPSEFEVRYRLDTEVLEEVSDGD